MSDTPNPTEAGFLQDIFAHPEDDTPRLIYADWLDNHQPARAQLIRVQCRLAKLEPDDPDRELLEMQEQDLLKEHAAVWTGHLPSWARKTAKFQRGFVNHLSTGARDYSRVNKLRLRVTFDSLYLNQLFRVQDLLDARLLAGIRRLTLTGGEAEVAHLLRSEQLADLESLELCACPVSEEVCQALVSNRRLDRLRRLVFTSTELGPDQARILSQAPLLSQLQELSINNGDPWTEAVRILGQSPHWRQLSRLSLAYCGLTAEEVRELIGSRMLRNVTALDLTRANLEVAIQDLVQAPGLRNLRHLELGSCGIDNAGMEALANASGLPRLTSLDLHYNLFTAEGASHFARSPLLSRLQRLVLGSWKLGPEVVKELVESSHCGQLRSLHLDNCGLGPEDVVGLAASPHLSRLTSLTLHHNRIGAKGTRALGASTSFPSLCYLDVSSNRISQEGARALVESPLARQLQGLNLKDNAIRVAFRQQLRSRLGPRLFL